MNAPDVRSGLYSLAEIRGLRRRRHLHLTVIVIIIETMNVMLKDRTSFTITDEKFSIL